VRAHGVTPEAFARIEAGAERMVDATCPKVAKIHEQLREYTARGYAVVIAGDPDHPEVVGLLGHAGNRAHVISTPEEVDLLGPLDPVLLVAQTTQDEENYARIRERFHARYPDGEALDTICTSTRRRQAELRRLVGEVEGVVVVGGRNSANTRRLFEISREAGVDAWLVESADELPLETLKNRASVAVTAGASTPRWIIEEVVNRLAAL